jgi:tRNA threonylcarbamoyladenosine biosynthesis protein TsaB
VIVLGLDTSGYANTVGVVDGDTVLSDMTYEARTSSLEQIVDNIGSALKSAGLTLDDVEGIGVGLGPGSWTGIRVGVTVGKMLAFSAKKPVCGVPTLEALAFTVPNESRLACAVISVGAGDAIYAACYNSENRVLERIGDYYVGGVTGLTGLITAPAVISGEGAAAYAKTISRESGIEVTGIEVKPNGVAVACIAERRLAQGDSDDVLSLTPLYLKESTAKAFVRRHPSTGSG